MTTKILRSMLAVAAGLFFLIQAKAQTVTLLDETLRTQESFDRFTAVSATGNQTWYFNPEYGAVISGYSNGSSHENEDWFLSPEIDLSDRVDENVRLVFEHTRGNAGAMNVGVTEGWYQVFVTAGYTGDPATTAWIELDGVIHATKAWQYVSSGELTIPAAVKSSATRFAFRYRSSDSQSATWEIKNVRVSSRKDSVPSDPDPDPESFKFATWNVEWLSCDRYEPEDDQLQMENVATVIAAMDPDVIALQEVGTSRSYATIDTLVKMLGENWGGHILPVDNSNCGQNQAIIYKKSRVGLAGGTILRNGASYQGNSYSWCWSSGRFPVAYEVNLQVDGSEIPVTFVNIHAKAMGDETSYLRRTGGSAGLKGILDGAAYREKNVIVIGDFNDYLIGTQCETCEQVSPYRNFIEDSQNYKGITASLTDVSYGNPSIDNMIISDELFGNYVAGSAMQELAVIDRIPDYYHTTSGHKPVSARFRFDAPEVQVEKPAQAGLSLIVYPNPVRSELKVENAEPGRGGKIEIYTLTGRLCRSIPVQGVSFSVDVSALPSGMYFMRIGNRTAKFVKE